MEDESKYLSHLGNTVVKVTKLGRMMLYGAITMGLCHLIASLCLKAGTEDESKKKLVSLTYAS